jgi:thymidylate synthase
MLELELPAAKTNSNKGAKNPEPVRDFPVTLIQGNCMANLWQQYVKFVFEGIPGIDDDLEIRECFLVTLYFEKGSDFEQVHPAMDLTKQQLYVEKLLSSEVHTVLGDSYGYRLRYSYGLDQVEAMVNRLVTKPESKAVCANLLHPIQSLIEQSVSMQRVACMTNMQVLLRENALNLIAHFRSQNAWNSHGNFKALHIWHKNFLNQLHKSGVEAELGSIAVVINAAHIYKCDFEKAASLI